MTHLGLGAMLHALAGGSEESPDKYYGLTIADAKVSDSELSITFDNGVSIKIWDDGQSCCEERFITCDDNASQLVGGKLVEISSSESKYQEDDYETHETCFVTVKTDQDLITMTTHNIHNGYYGGFGLTITEVSNIGE
jgi:hypothetical protein